MGERVSMAPSCLGLVEMGGCKDLEGGGSGDVEAGTVEIEFNRALEQQGEHAQGDVGADLGVCAVMDGTQVAFLAPTTVLAFQHLKTLKERFAAFPA